MKKLYLIPLMFLLTISLVLGVGETMTRAVPLSAETDGTFPIFYIVDGDAPWGVSIIDLVSGGCTFPGGSSTLNEAYLSIDYPGNEIVVDIMTTGVSDTCIFNGDYKFDIQDIVNFPEGAIAITTPSNGGGGGGGGGTAPTFYRYDSTTNTCTLINLWSYEITDDDSSTLSGCEQNIILEEEKSYTWIIILLILGGVGYYFYKNQ